MTRALDEYKPVYMTLFWHPTGPMMQYGDGTLAIDDLNPEIRLRWRMSRWDMLRLGWRCILAAARAPSPEAGFGQLGR